MLAKYLRKAFFVWAKMEKILLQRYNQNRYLEDERNTNLVVIFKLAVRKRLLLIRQ